MDSKKTIPISEARKEIFKIADRVQNPSTYYTLTEKGKPKAVILSAEEFESWQETLEVMKDFPGIEKEAKKAEEEYVKGEYSALEEILSREGFSVRKDNLNDVRGSSKKKSGKRS